MVKIIMGLKGSGKTKQLIELVKKAIEDEKGNVVCIEKGPKLTYDIPHSVRLIESSQYGFENFSFLQGFLSGLHAGNYDITHVFIDSLNKLVDRSVEETVEFLDWLAAFSEKEKVKFTLTISADTAIAPEGIRKFF